MCLYERVSDDIQNKRSPICRSHFGFTTFYTKIRTDKPANGQATKMTNSRIEAAYDYWVSTFRACSYDSSACRDIAPSGTNISVHSYKAFHPACRDKFKILFISARETCIHLNHAA